MEPKSLHSNHPSGDTKTASLKKMLKFIKMSIVPVPPISYTEKDNFIEDLEPCSFNLITSSTCQAWCIGYFSSFKSHRSSGPWLLFPHFFRWRNQREIGKGRVQSISACSTWWAIHSNLPCESQCGSRPLICHPIQDFSHWRRNFPDFWNVYAYYFVFNICRPET